MRRSFLLLLMLFSLHATAQTQSDEQFIRTMLDRQVSEWNQGRVAGYMIGYWENDSLVFIGKSGPTYGYASTLARYRKAYPDAAHMGRLQSTILKLRLLSPEWAYVTGRWELTRKAGNLAGYYTLLLRKMNGNWVIVEDHSS